MYHQVWVLVSCCKRMCEAFCSKCVVVIISVFGWQGMFEVPLTNMNKLWVVIIPCVCLERSFQICYWCRVPFRSWFRNHFLEGLVYCALKGTLPTFLPVHGVCLFLSIQYLSFRRKHLVLLEIAFKTFLFMRLCVRAYGFESSVTR